MNSKDFIQALRKVIREEVQTAVRTEMSKFNVITETKAPVNKYPVYNKSTVTQKVQSKKQFVKDPMLNSLLNETNGFKSDGPVAYMEEQVSYNDYSEWPTMKNNINPMMGGMTAQKSIVPTTDTEGRPVNVNQLAQTEAGAAVVNALTKDYSALMKAIDKKKGK